MPVIGVVGVSNGLRWLLARYEKPTLGALLGLLLGAVVGLYPFQEPVPPALGFEDHGRTVLEAELANVPKEDWPLERFTPSSSELVASGGTIALGLFLTYAISRFRSKTDR